MSSSHPIPAWIPLVFISMLPLSGCSRAVTPEVPADWIRIEADSQFSLMAPPGTVYHKGEGIDSFIGTLEAPGFTLSFDYGLYSNSLSDLGVADYETKRMIIDGREALLVTALTPHLSDERPYFIGIHFSNIKTTVIGSTKLTIMGSLENQEHYSLIKKVFKTIRLR